MHVYVDMIFSSVDGVKLFVAFGQQLRRDLVVIGKQAIPIRQVPKARVCVCIETAIVSSAEGV
jgi:hypothetical protein